MLQQCAVVECSRLWLARGFYCTSFFSPESTHSVPFTKVASRSKQILQEGCRRAMAALQILGTRLAHIVIDETVWHPQYEVMTGLREQMGYIGGFVNRADGEDFSYQLKTPDVDLDPQNLSKLCGHFVITRGDCNKHCWMVDMLPRAPKRQGSSSSQSALADIAAKHFFKLFMYMISSIAI